MDDPQALQVVKMVEDLWPNVAMTDIRRTFYAMALKPIPDLAQALRVVRDLFLDEVFPPPPGMILDRCLDVGGAAIGAWQTLIAHALAGGDPPDVTASTVLRSIGGNPGKLPLDNDYRLDKLRVEFLDAYRVQARSAAQEAATALSKPQPPRPTPIASVDTTGAARSL